MKRIPGRPVFWFLVLLASGVCLPSCQKKVDAGSPAPEFSLKDLSGGEVSLSRHRGHVVLLDFWATWCAPCRQSIPELVELQERYRRKGLVVLGVSLDDPRQVPDPSLLAFKKKHRVNYPLLRADAGVVADYFKDGNVAIPTLFLIDRGGKIRDRIVGFSPGAVEKSLKGILK